MTDIMAPAVAAMRDRRKVDIFLPFGDVNVTISLGGRPAVERPPWLS
jgi:hypothetical protein